MFADKANVTFSTETCRKEKKKANHNSEKLRVTRLNLSTVINRRSAVG